MRFPLHITTDMIGHQVRQSLRGNSRYPFVLMLEPLYTCNLACIGCSTERHTGKLADRLPVETCLKAVDDCGAPSVSICGGEPTLYPELPALVGGIIARKRHIYLCTNGLVLDSKVFGKIAPQKRLTINVHLDGMRATHDQVCAREGVFDKAIEMIGEAKRLGYHVMTNTTVFKHTEVAELEELCALLTGLGVDGLLISPGYHYESVAEDIFLTRQEIQKKFQRVLELSKKYPLSSTPMYLEFAAGQRDYDCSPWSTVTFTPRGWKGPCYLIGDRYTAEWSEFWAKTDWSYWESRQDARCQNCAMHSGFEASAVRQLSKSPRDMVRMAAWNFLGVSEAATAIVAAMAEETEGLLPRLLAPTAMTLEGARVTLGRLAGQRVALAVTGDGPHNARRGLAAVLAALPVGRVIVCGVAGGLSEGLAQGAVVVCQRLVDERTGEVRSATLESAAGGVAVTARRIADTVADKRRLLELARQAGDGPAVVDLESTAFAAVAAGAGLPWLVVRSVSDRADEALPALLERSRDEGGAVRRGRVLRGLLTNPGALPALLSLRGRVRACAGELARAVEALLVEKATP